MSDASPSLGGRLAVRLPHYSVADRAVADRAVADRAVADRPPSERSAANPGAAHSGGTAPGDPDFIAGDGKLPAAEPDGAEHRALEHGGYGGSAHTLAAERDAADLTDLSHSLGDGARYAVDVAHARGQGETPAARAAKLRLQQALHHMRRICAQAMRQRMQTEMADLASQIRKMHDRDNLPR